MDVKTKQGCIFNSALAEGAKFGVPRRQRRYQQEVLKNKIQMGGKSYYCDYCRCYLKNDVNVRKLHNVGLTHKIAKTNYMRRYDDPRQVFAEEIAKAPCSRYLNGGYCKFDLYCQYRHFNDRQMRQLQQIVERLERQKPRNSTRDDASGDWRKLLPWHAPAGVKRKRQRKIKKLPPSLKPINFNKLTDDCFNVAWG